MTGKNVTVEVNDTGIDAIHPDLSAGNSVPSRVIGDAAQSLVDTNGHGTHVAGIIAGNGTESITVTNAQWFNHARDRLRNFAAWRRWRRCIRWAASMAAPIPI